MRHLFAALLTLAVLVCLAPAARADEGLVLAGTCSDDGSWDKANLKNLPAKAVTGQIATPAEATVISGLKLREATDGRPLEAKTIGNVKAGSTVKVVALRVMGASPGAAHAVWAKVQVEPDRVIKQ